MGSDAESLYAGKMKGGSGATLEPRQGLDSTRPEVITML